MIDSRRRFSALKRTSATDIVFYEYDVNTRELLNSEIVKVPDPSIGVTITTTLTGFVQMGCDVYQNGEWIGGYYPIFPYVHSITINGADFDMDMGFPPPFTGATIVLNTSQNGEIYK